MAASGNRVELSIFVASTTGCVASTTTACSCTAASGRFRFTVSPTPSRTPERRVSLNPTARAVTSYVPSGMRGAMKTPRSLVATWRWKPVCDSRMTTVAPATGVPDGSVTVPRISPVVACDCAASRTGNRRANTTGPRSLRTMLRPPTGWEGCFGTASVSLALTDRKKGRFRDAKRRDRPPPQ